MIDRLGRVYRLRPGPKPRRPDARASVKISVRLTPEERADLEQVALSNGTTLTGFLRDAVNTAVEECRESGPVFRRTSVQSPTA